MMKRLLPIAVAALALSGCAAMRDLSSDNPYEKPPFYAKYLNTGAPVDTYIARTLDALRANPDSAELHNALGTMLIEKGFPKDAELEFERAVNSSRRYYPAWYNLGLVRASRGDELGATRALRRTVQLKPGHAQALFQLGLVEEKRQHIDSAVRLYAKAYAINPSLLRVDVNPRILDSKLTALALLRNYPATQTRKSMQLQGGADPRETVAEAPSPQPAAKNIVTPAPPVTDPSQQPAPKAPVVAPKPPAAKPPAR
jgi:tetratricopeptide (TPR) repeat protein